MFDGDGRLYKGEKKTTMSFRLFDVKEDKTKCLKLNQLHDDSPLVYYFIRGGECNGELFLFHFHVRAEQI